MTNNLIRRRACVVSAAISLLGAALLGGAPTASADTNIDLDNGLTVKITAPNPDLREIAVYPTDGEVHFMLPSDQQIDNPHLTHITRSQTPVRVQSCWQAAPPVSSNCRPWSTIDPFKYENPRIPLTIDPGPLPPLPPVKCLGSPVKEVPAGQICPAPMPSAPKDAVHVSFDRGDRGSVTWNVNVTSTAAIPGKCTYVATNTNGVWPPFNKTFDIPANGSAPSFPVPAPPPFSTYRVETKCKGTWGGQTIEFGDDVQDVP